MTAKNLSETENPLTNMLSSWGLSRAEAKVYLYLVQKVDESGGSKIAIGTKLHRQYVYIALERLIELGLVEAVKFGKYKKYKALSPIQIEKITRKRSVQASDLVIELNKISAIHNDQDFEVLQGARQIKQYEMDYVRECEEGEEEFIIGGHTEGYSELMGEDLEDYLGELKNKQIKVSYLGSENERGYYEQYIGKFPNQQYRFLKKLPQGVTHMVIRKSTVLFFSFLTPPLVYVIKSEVVAKNYKDFFMMLWDMAGE